MDLYARAGAKYFVAQAMHHDNFDNFNSVYQPRFNSVAMGPQKDILMLWKEQAKKHGLPFGVSEHLGASYAWLGVAKGCDAGGPFKGVPYDGNDDAYSDLYYQGNNGHKLFEKDGYDRAGWYTKNEAFHKHWFLRIKDLIDKVQPDLLYSDGGIPFRELDSDLLHEQSVHETPFDEAQKGARYGLKIVAHLYNTSVAVNGRNLAVYTQKDRNSKVFGIGILDIERSREDKITPYYWQTDTSIGDWFYNLRDVYKPWNEIVETIIDIASMNGNILLNINQKPDGTLDYECVYALRQIAKWMGINGEGIFGTRHFRTPGEGLASFKRREGFDEHAVEWAPGDIRYTQKANTVYAFLMRRPNGSQAVLRELNASRERVGRVSLLGGGALDFAQNGAALVVDLPDYMPSEMIHCMKIECENKL